MMVATGKLVNGKFVLTKQRVIEQSIITSDCWLVQFNGLKACETCNCRGRRTCGGGETLQKMLKAAKEAE